MTDDVTAAIVAERGAVLSFARRTGLQLDLLVQLGTMSREDADAIKRRISDFADAVAMGVHIEFDPPAVRAAMRDVMQPRDGVGA